MQLSCFFINDHLVVVKQIKDIHVCHFIRGEKSTRVSGFTEVNWQRLFLYLTSSLGVAEDSEISIKAIFNKTGDAHVKLLRNACNNLAITRVSLAKNSGKFYDELCQSFEPLTATFKLNQQTFSVSELTDGVIKNKLKNIAEKEKTSVSKEPSKLEDNQAVEDHSSKKDKSSFLKPKNTIWVKAVYGAGVFNELNNLSISYGSSTLSGSVSNLKGSAFTVTVDGYSLYVMKSSVLMELNGDKSLLKRYLPVKGEKVTVYVDMYGIDHSLRVSLEKQ